MSEFGAIYDLGRLEGIPLRDSYKTLFDEATTAKRALDITISDVLRKDPMHYKLRNLDGKCDQFMHKYGETVDGVLRPKAGATAAVQKAFAKVQKIHETLPEKITTYLNGGTVDKIGALPDSLRNLVNLEGTLEQHMKGLEAYADFKDGVFVQKSGVQKDFFDAALKKVEDSQKNLNSYLRGEAVDGIASKAPEEISTVFKHAEKAAEKVTKPANSFFGGMARTQGWGEALKYNLQDMNPARSGLKTSVRFQAGGKAALAVGLGVLAIDSVARSQTKDGEERSTLARVGLGTAALVALGAVLFGGRAGAVARV